MRFVEKLLHAFVAARFWIAPFFIFSYYGQLYLPTLLAGTRFRGIGNVTQHLILLILSIIFLGAIAANPLWVADYRSRLAKGIEYVRSREGAVGTSKEILEQMRWSSTKLLGIVTVLLALIGQVKTLLDLPIEHQPALLVLVMLIIVSLFDAALDLEAEWTIATLSAAKQGDEPEARLALAIWETNQFRESQQVLLRRVKHKKEFGEIQAAEFTAAAKNVIAFAIVLTTCLAAYGIVLLAMQIARLH